MKHTLYWNANNSAMDACQWGRIHTEYSHDGSRMKRLFFRLRMLQMGFRGFKSSRVTLTVNGSTTTGIVFFSGSLVCLVALRSAFRRTRSIACFSAAWYVKLRSRRKVSVKKKKLQRAIPPRMVRRKNVALQFHTVVTAPPSNGPNDGPRRGAA